jgi:hypothetical protein
MLCQAMSGARKLAAPIVLKDGRTIATLCDARAVMLALPERRQRGEPWLCVGALMLEAEVQTGPLGETAAHLRRTLKAEGLI